VKVSVVMAYYNRKPLIESTLQSISHSSYHDYEIIVVDDASAEEHRIEDLVENFNMDIKLIRLDPDEKTHVNPCIPYNIGFKQATGDIIVIQNPECFHLGDIITDASKIQDNEYKVYHCYSLPEDKTEKLINGEPQQVMFLDRSARFNGDEGYYVHGVLNRRPYHFCSAITKKDLDDLGGFDERYAHASSYDDDELAHRIQKKGMNILYIHNPLVTHLWHYSSNEEPKNSNKDLFFNKTLKEDGWKVNTKL